MLELTVSVAPPKIIMKRNWRNYSKELLLNMLSVSEFDYSINDVQQFWNNLENKIIKIVDTLAPIVEFTNNHTTATSPITLLKPLINKKRRLLKRYKTSKQHDILTKFKELDKLIIETGKKTKRNTIRRSLLPGNTKSLWNAIKLAKDINPNMIAESMTENGIDITPCDLSDTFAQFFDKKVKSIVETCRVENNVYNGLQKINGIESNLMTT